MRMFCFQCEQAAESKACYITGTCGKDPAVAALQDLLIYGLKGLSMYAYRARQLGMFDSELDRFTLELLSTTITNVNFDQNRHVELVKKLANYKLKAKELYFKACYQNNVSPEDLNGPALWEPAESFSKIIAQGEQVSISKRKAAVNDDVTGFEEFILYGVKGYAAYAYQALSFGNESDEIYAFTHEALDFLACSTHTVDELFDYVLKTGVTNLKAMELLDKAHTEALGFPEPTQVRVNPIKGKSILISGHDLKVLEELLKQTDGKGINIYTHGEMLPAHAYPGLKKYKHLIGNYGGAWQNQRKEFEEFPGAVLMTSGCFQEPAHFYRGRIFTTGLAGWHGVIHVDKYDFQRVINAAFDADGFMDDAEEQYITVGFARNAVLNMSDEIIRAIKKGELSHLFFIGGCDGEKHERSYYTSLAQSIPMDSIIFTSACGKYRFNKIDFGKIGEIPRLLDLGQCNDIYSLIQILSNLAEALESSINELSVSIILSWYEQKAVAVLLTFFALGIKNIRLGPTLPAFITPKIFEMLNEKFNLMPISTVDEDLKTILE